MLLGFKTQLRVNKQQRLLLAQHAGVARHAWNQGLALCQQVIIHNKTHPEAQIKFPTSIDLHKWLVASIKSIYPWYYEVSKCAPQYALKYLSDAFKSVTISRQADQWFISWKIEVDPERNLRIDLTETPKRQDSVGVDLVC